MVNTVFLSFALVVVLVNAYSAPNSEVMPAIPDGDVFDGQNLSEIISLWFSNDGFKMSGRHVTKSDTRLHSGLTQETGFSNGGLHFGRGHTGHFLVNGIDMRDPTKFINCPAGSIAELRYGGICCKNAPGDSCNSDNTGGQFRVPNMGIMVRAKINFGNYSKICFNCENLLFSNNNYPKSSTCTGEAGELEVTRGDQTIFSVPVEGSTNNFRLVFKRTNQLTLAEHNDGCRLSKLYHEVTLYAGGSRLAYWRVVKYHNIWLEDGKDHEFLLLVPRIKTRGAYPASTPSFPLLYIDGKYICVAPLAQTTDYISHCVDRPRQYPPVPVHSQELTNTKCSLTRLYLGNAPETWATSSASKPGQPTSFRASRGLKGATYKSFQMWNYHGIAEPANLRLCSGKNSIYCSPYTMAPACKNTDWSFTSSNSLSSGDWATVLTPPLVQKTGCPVSAPPKCKGDLGSATEIGTASNCRFLGDSCSSGACCKPGVCCSTK